MDAIDRFVSHVAVKPGDLACDQCLSRWPNVTACGPVWQVAQPRKPPPDLGTQPFTMPQRSPSVNLYTRRTYA
jgi:hypothetical protein